MKVVIKESPENGHEQIAIVYKDYLNKKQDNERSKHYTIIRLPSFKEGTMYRGMELNRRYTLEELCLEKREWIWWIHE